MSKVRLYGSTSGFVELAAPAISDDGVLVLPTAAQGILSASGGIGSNVVQAVKTNTFSTSSQTFVNVPDLSVTITPSTDTSRILVLGMVAVSQTVQAEHTGPHLRVVRDSTPIFVGDADTRSPVTFGINGQLNPRLALSVVVSAVDLPATSDPVTYKIQIRILQATGTAVVNRLGTDSASDLRFPRMFSSLTVIEVTA